MTPQISTRAHWPARVCEFCTKIKTRNAPVCELAACPRETIRVESPAQYWSLCARQRYQHREKPAPIFDLRDLAKPAALVEPAPPKSKPKRRRRAGSGLTGSEISRLGATVRWRKWREKQQGSMAHKSNGKKQAKADMTERPAERDPDVESAR